ncbi:hypothetical protein GO986_15200 [Deinococcus sp. HMF7620]|uniref:Uncharacterized protein n=1 Tax=Deinococcus arboris TaxID=2682977 RepID=A0A7C9LMA9_9DEIO|nr:hypothetical protein [Deinococcus arboris]MVN88098.1 hypothetical protein [Deinococcus arboris]
MNRDDLLLPKELINTTPDNLTLPVEGIYTPEFLLIIQLRYYCFSSENYPPDEWLPNINPSWTPVNDEEFFTKLETILKDLVDLIKRVKYIDEAIDFINRDERNIPLIREIVNLSRVQYREMRKIGFDPKKLHRASLIIFKFISIVGDGSEDELREFVGELNEYK